MVGSTTGIKPYSLVGKNMCIIVNHMNSLMEQTNAKGCCSMTFCKYDEIVCLSIFSDLVKTYLRLQSGNMLVANMTERHDVDVS